MSTRCTIAYDQKDFHLYQECFENDNVYLQLDGDGWAASLETSAVDWRGGDSSSPTLSLRIDVVLWRKIVEGWLASQWGQDPSRDRRKDDWDPDAAGQWLASLTTKKEGE